MNLHPHQQDKKTWCDEKNANRKKHDPVFVVICCSKCGKDVIVTQNSPADKQKTCSECWFK